MNALVFGGMGMLGQAVVRECLRDDSLTQVIAVRESSGINRVATGV